MQKIIQKFENGDDNILTNDDICCRIIPSELIEDIVPLLSRDDCLKLVCGQNAAMLCNRYGLDGVVIDIDTSKPIKKQIDIVKKDIGKKYLGVVCPPKRHEAMLCSECEPDFIIFKTNEENKNDILSVVPWYNELFLIQSALDIEEFSVEYRSLDTDFIIINSQNYKNFGC